MRRWCAISAFLMYAAVIGSALAYPGLVLPTVPFEATAVHEVGRFERRVTVHYADGKLRIDPGHGFSVTILDFATETQCLLMANHTYLVLPMDDELFRQYIALIPRLSGASKLGEQNIDGRDAIKYGFADSGPLAASGTYWITRSGIMLRRYYVDNQLGGDVQQREYLTRLTLSTQPPSLFVVPPGYKSAR